MVAYLETSPTPRAKYEDIREWLGEEFDPEAFDLAAVKEELGA